MPTDRDAVLRLADEGDVALYRRLYTCPRVMAQIAPPLGAADAEAAFTRVVAHNRRAASPLRTWVVEAADGARACGIVTLRQDHDVGDIGLMLLPEAWNRHVAHAAIRAVLEHAFLQAGVAAVTADCREGVNVRLLRRLLGPFGFRQCPPMRAGYADWRLERADWRRPGVLAPVHSSG